MPDTSPPHGGAVLLADRPLRCPRTAATPGEPIPAHAAIRVTDHATFDDLAIPAEQVGSSRTVLATPAWDLFGIDSGRADIAAGQPETRARLDDLRRELDR
ncbi:hypothetical protein ACIRRA_43355 [Nocardia sp. NPDC101769]|uniref:hypothetical protein n=1 Tax=Nocardia sp. NPDC101769 TaxID=3364333 RepID=UPI003825E2F7